MLLTEGLWYASQVLYGDFHFVTSSLSHQPNLITINESPFTLRQNQVFLLKRCSVHSIQIHDLDLKLTGCPLRMDEWLWRLHLSVVTVTLAVFSSPFGRDNQNGKILERESPGLPSANKVSLKHQLCSCVGGVYDMVVRNQSAEKWGPFHSRKCFHPVSYLQGFMV